VSSGFVRNLKYYGELYQRFLSKEYKVEDLRFIPLLAYDISRNIKSEDVQQWAGGLRNQIGKTEELYYLSIIVDYALLLKE